MLVKLRYLNYSGNRGPQILPSRAACSLFYVVKTTFTKIRSHAGHTKFILIMKTNEMHYFSSLFHEVLCMFRTGSLSIIRSI